MIVKHIADVPAQEEHGIAGVEARWPIRAEDGAPHFAMRVFDLQPGVSTPLHRHWWEHEVYVLAGTGQVVGRDTKHELREGVVVFIAGDERHQLVNTGDTVLRFICLIPHPWLHGVAQAHAQEFAGG